MDLSAFKDLWKRTFHDSDAFIDLYFEHRYSPATTDFVERDGQLVAQLQRIPYPLYYHDMVLDMAYVSGVCTDEKHRRKGVMRQLLRQSHERMYANGTAVATLIPAENWLKDYYGSMGYARSFQRTQSAVFAKDWTDEDRRLPLLQLQSIQMNDYLFSDAQWALERFMKQHAVAVLHTVADMQVVFADMALANGKVWVGKRDGRIVAIAFAVPQEGGLVLTELLGESARMRRALMYSLFRQEQPTHLLYPVIDPTLPREWGMARIIHAEHVLRMYAVTHPQEEWTLEVTDALLPQNNGVYHLHGGVCQRLTTPQPNAEKHDIASLTAWWLRDEAPYMSLMMN